MKKEVRRERSSVGTGLRALSVIEGFWVLLDFLCRVHGKDTRHVFVVGNQGVSL